MLCVGTQAIVVPISESLLYRFEWSYFVKIWSYVACGMNILRFIASLLLHYGGCRSFLSGFAF